MPYSGSWSPALEAHLLGRIEFARCLAFQHRVVDRIAQRSDGQICLLLCEHPKIVTVGRAGAPSDVQFGSGPIRDKQMEVRWVKRGGGSLVHAPGQLAIYPILPLRWHGFSIGEYLDRLQMGVANAISRLGIPTHSKPGCHGLWGRTGQLAAIGIAVRDWVTYHGAYINVSPPMGLLRLVDADPQGATRIGCLMAERGRPIRMSGIRAELIPRLAEAFGCDRYHLHTGHPLLQEAALARPSK